MQTTAISEEIQQLCRQQGALALSLSTNTLLIAVTNKYTPELEADLRFATGLHIQHQCWPAAQLENALNQLHGEHPLDELQRVAQQQKQRSVEHYTQESDQDEPVVRFINQTLQLAIQRRASDVHFEPFEHHFQIRLRIDGVLQPVSSPPHLLAARITARLKIISQLDIAERRLPQDGQLKIMLDRQSYNMRIATLPTQHGEKVVLRLQDNSGSPRDLSQLGMNQVQLQHYQQALHSPQGLLLVTGPTGSGKTLTLYSGLKTLNNPQRNICSVEDPIEMTLDGINQSPVNPKIGFTFSHILRALLRQDPDVIMLGEIRDAETAEIAVKAAQTGHLVLSTLHTNSTCEAVIRLENMGIAPYLLASSLKLVIAQRLVRQLCPHCKQPHSEKNIKPQGWVGSFHTWHAQGCEHCFSGYYGRTALYEMLPITHDIQQSLLAGANVSQLQALAEQQGMCTLWQMGLQHVNSGMTSLEELHRVLGNLE